MTLERALNLLADARAVAERRTFERDEANSALAAQAADAAYGRALRSLIWTIRRLRLTTSEETFGMSLAEHMRSELDEVEGEEPGSPQAQAECGDVLALALNLAEEHCADVVAELVRVEAKLRERLDMLDGGRTWDEAKEIQRGRA